VRVVVMLAWWWLSASDSFFTALCLQEAQKHDGEGYQGPANGRLDELRKVIHLVVLLHTPAVTDALSSAFEMAPADGVVGAEKLRIQFYVARPGEEADDMVVRLIAEHDDIVLALVEDVDFLFHNLVGRALTSDAQRRLLAFQVGPPCSRAWCVALVTTACQCVFGTLQFAFSVWCVALVTTACQCVFGTLQFAFGVNVAQTCAQLLTHGMLRTALECEKASDGAVGPRLPSSPITLALWAIVSKATDNVNPNGRIAKTFRDFAYVKVRDALAAPECLACLEDTRTTLRDKVCAAVRVHCMFVLWCSAACPPRRCRVYCIIFRGRRRSRKSRRGGCNFFGAWSCATRSLNACASLVSPTCRRRLRLAWTRHAVSGNHSSRRHRRPRLQTTRAY
jgi:hypothetical protein